LRLPRDVSGDDLIKRLARVGYQESRQTGSHVRLTRMGDGEHHITVPRGKELRVGTLSSILREVTDHLQISRDELIRIMWE
jgi:predicted RNA binding protein YcfA (HicA-like mRNA interferase family)